MTDKELTKQILNLAGYDIIFEETVYTILKDGVKVQTGSSEMTPKRAIGFIQLKSFHRGIDEGKEQIQSQLKTLLNL